MFRPFLFVGLGGSGGKTLRFVKKELQLWLNEVAPEEANLPEAWQFLHIDSPTVQDGSELNSFVDMLDQDEYLGLVGPDVQFNAIANGLDAINGMQHELVGWRIDPASMDVPIGIGAGQYRAIGRTIAMLHGKEIRTALQACYDTIDGPKARSQLAELFTVANSGQAPGPHDAPVVIVVSSLAGGTGAGLLMTVFDLLSSVGKGETVGVLYTPEVFGAIGGQLGSGGVYANSLAAISEVLNGHWFHGGQKIGYRSPADLTHASSAQRLRRSGPSYPFLVGMRNASGTSFSSSKDLFEMVGASLASWATDKSIQDQLVAYTLGNWDTAASTTKISRDILVNAGEPEEWGKPAINALGVSRLSVGQRYFLNYAAKRLARDAGVFLSKNHVEGQSARNVIRVEGLTEPTEIARLLAKKSLPQFLRQAGLSERGRDDNQILDALKPTDADDLELQFRNRVTELVSHVGDDNQEGWRDRIFKAVKSEMERFLNEYSDGVRTSVATWCKSKPLAVTELVYEEIAREGLHVAAAEIQLAVDYFCEPGAVIDELKEERADFENDGTDSSIREVIDEETQRLSSRGKISASHPDIATTIFRAVFQAGNRADAIVREQATAVIDSFANDFLRPLARALSSASGSAEVTFQEEAINWPSWEAGAPPKHMEPPASEVTLIEADDYAGLFDSMLAADVKAGPDATPTQIREEVRSTIISGSFLNATDTPVLDRNARVYAVGIERDWWPGTAVVPGENRTASSAIFSINLDPSHLEQRAHWWMSRPNREFSKLRHESLRTYLQEDTTFGSQQESRETYRDRQRRFVPKLMQALDSAAPLVDIDNNVMRALGTDISFDRIITQVPFLNIPEFGERIEQTLRSAGVQKVEMTTDSTVQEISISSTLKAPVYPIAVKSLLGPISEDWAVAAMSNVGMNAFWNRRRARRMDEFIPAPYETIAAMTRGWFTGRILGVVEVDSQSGLAQIGRLHREPAEFPHPRLDQSPDKRDALPLILEALALAYVEVSRRGDLSPLEAYCELRDLGRSGEASGVLDYGYGNTANPLLTAWIMEGELPADVQIGKCNVSGATPVERREALLNELHKVSETYRDHLEQLQREWNANPYKVGQPPYWPGMHGHIATALETLQKAVGNLDITETPDY